MSTASHALRISFHHSISVKTTMVSLMGLPRITISVVALSRVLPNVMNMPFISGFISSSIDTAVAEYVAPKSLTLDLQRLISGDDIKKDTDAIGVLVVHIHRAVDVKRMDMSGGSGACNSLFSTFYTRGSWGYLI